MTATLLLLELSCKGVRCHLLSKIRSHSKIRCSVSSSSVFRHYSYRLRTSCFRLQYNFPFTFQNKKGCLNLFRDFLIFDSVKKAHNFQLFFSVSG